LAGAALLQRDTYEEVEADRGANMEALAVVLLSSAAAGVGSAGFGTRGLSAVVLFSVIALVSWGMWAFVTTQIGAKLLPEAQTRADVGELLRTTGFAAAPGIARVLCIVPVLARPVLVISSLWMLVAMIVAVRQALDYTSTARAVMVCVLGWSVAIGFALLFGLVFGPRLS
jgi:hypothetical protein